MSNEYHKKMERIKVATLANKNINRTVVIRFFFK